ncbi:MAG: hypothetical protein KBE25_08440, partial [Laribacter sp.]|nr:hypothetical protein [Laribacter sp.]
MIFLKKKKLKHVALKQHFICVNYVTHRTLDCKNEITRLKTPKTKPLAKNEGFSHRAGAGDTTTCAPAGEQPDYIFAVQPPPTPTASALKRRSYPIT